MSPSPEEVERALGALRGYETLALGTVSAAGPHVAGVFFAPEVVGSGLGLVLLLAVLRGSRKHRELVEDARVAFMCSPGVPTRWVQGEGEAAVVDGEDEGADALRRLKQHSPGASVFVDRLPVVPVLVSVRTLKVVEELGKPALVLDFRQPR